MESKFSKLQMQYATKPEVISGELEDVFGGCSASCGAASCGASCATTCNATCITSATTGKPVGGN